MRLFDVLLLIINLKYFNSIMFMNWKTKCKYHPYDKDTLPIDWDIKKIHLSE